MTLPFFTIGHSNRSLAEFIAMLTAAQIGLVADVRTVPKSRANPQFNRDTLPESLQEAGIDYEHMPRLGGLRPKSRTVPPETNALWTNDSFHNYADYALSADFHDGLAHLIERGRTGRTAVMCSEAVWWRCHRRIIADHLLASGETVFHIMGAGRLEAARLTTGAARGSDGSVVYPPRTAALSCPPLVAASARVRRPVGATLP
jgi:uncharacterized protein (DUF488 family)